MRKLGVEIKRVTSFLHAHTPDKVYPAYQEQLALMQRNISEGTLDAAKAADAWAIGDFRADFEIKFRVGRLELKEKQKQSLAILSSIAERAAEAINRLADKIEAHEREWCERFGCEHTPSAVLIGVGQAGWRIKGYLNAEMTWSTPEELCARVGIKF